VIGETRYSKQELTAVIVEQLRSRLSEIEQQISDLEKTVDGLERKYGVGWEVFRERFGSGELGEEADLDYVEWHAAVELLEQLRRERDMLVEVLS
jgi:phage-related minor tail protein